MTDINQRLKSNFYQGIRLVDVFLIGTTMIYAGMKCKDMNKVLKLFLIGTGAATIIFNGKNYLDIEKDKL